MSVVVERGGVFTTVQDAGRYGYQKYGMTPSGPMDLRSFYWANVLVGNPKEAAALETAYMGLVLRFSVDCVVAVTGADLMARVDQEPAPLYEAFTVHAGETLSFHGIANGARAYVAFAGGLDVPLVMGSAATSARFGIGGYQGRKLEAGDVLKLAAPRASLPDMEQRRVYRETFPKGTIRLRVVLGPQQDSFTEKGIQDFFTGTKEITNDFDRMGCRLECEPIEHSGDGNIISDGIAFGAIQIPPNGKPIIMLADRQTVGGYPKIGTVIEADLWRLGQAMPGDVVRFTLVDRSAAVAALREAADWLERLRSAAALYRAS